MVRSMTLISPRNVRALSLLLLPLFAACGSDTTTVVAPTPVSITETFAGTLNRNGGTTYPVVVGQGQVTVTLNTLTPDNTIAIGLALGTWNGVSCAITITNDKALPGVSVVGSVNTVGSVCVRVYDVGNVANPLTYEVKVVHF